MTNLNKTCVHFNAFVGEEFKALDKHGNCFNYIVKKFPGLSREIMKAGIFYGPQIRKLIQDQALLLT